MSDKCFSNYIHSIICFISSILLLGSIILSFLVPRIENVVWPVIVVSCIMISINFMLYYGNKLDRLNSKKNRISPHNSATKLRYNPYETKIKIINRNSHNGYNTNPSLYNRSGHNYGEQITADWEDSIC